MRGDGIVVDDQVGFAHQLFAVLHVAGKARQRVHHPELGKGELHPRPAPAGGEALHVQGELAANHDIVDALRLPLHVHAPEQGRDAREQVRQADVLGEVVVGPHAQAGHDVYVAVAGREEDDRQLGRQDAQVAAQGEAAVVFVPEADVQYRQIGQPRLARRDRFGARTVGLNFVAVLFQRIGIVGADGRIVLDQGNAAWHAFIP